jgi:hypothetical protein
MDVSVVDILTVLLLGKSAVYGSPTAERWRFGSQRSSGDLERKPKYAERLPQ